MSENGNQAPAPTIVKQPAQFSQTTCTCGKPMAVRLPRISVFNSITVSVITFTHERFDKCPNCQGMFVPKVAGVDGNGTIAFQWQKIEVKEASNIIAPTQSNMAQAIDFDKLKKEWKQ